MSKNWEYLGLLLVVIGYFSSIKTMLAGMFIALFTLLTQIYDRQSNNKEG